MSSNIRKALIPQPSANIIVCSDFNAHNTEWLCHTHTIDVAGLFCQEFAMVQGLTCIPNSDDHPSYIRDLFLCSNPDYCTVASHPPWENLTI